VAPTNAPAPHWNSGGKPGVIAPITLELAPMPRLLPHYLIFVAAHALLIAAVIALN